MRKKKKKTHRNILYDDQLDREAREKNALVLPLDRKCIV
jgi:hypothetical protein